jgi:hypothetical protein
MGRGREMKRREAPVIPVDPTKWYAVGFGTKPFL